jgi:hypothetical protein
LLDESAANANGALAVVASEADRGGSWCRMKEAVSTVHRDVAMR